MLRKFGLAGATAIILATTGGSAAQAAGPDVCDQFVEPAMQQYQLFDDDTQAVIDAAVPCR
jgi:hypothetical protein